MCSFFFGGELGYRATGGLCIVFNNELKVYRDVGVYRVEGTEKGGNMSRAFRRGSCRGLFPVTLERE